MLKFFGLMTVGEHEVAMAEHKERGKISAETISALVDDVEALKLALRRERKAVDWFRVNSAIRCPQTKQILSKRKAQKAYAEMWVNL